MAAPVQASKSKAFFRVASSGAFDQYLQDIQKLPLIKDVEVERALARRAQQGDPAAAERLVTANLRFVISYVKKYQGHGRLSIVLLIVRVTTPLLFQRLDLGSQSVKLLRTAAGAQVSQLRPSYRAGITRLKPTSSRATVLLG